MALTTLLAILWFIWVRSTRSRYDTRERALAARAGHSLQEAHLSLKRDDDCRLPVSQRGICVARCRIQR
jgi:hypothetical protein